VAIDTFPYVLEGPARRSGRRPAAEPAAGTALVLFVFFLIVGVIAIVGVGADAVRVARRWLGP
jgi:hypothetical protein